MLRRPPISTRTATRFPYTTLFRSKAACAAGAFRLNFPSDIQSREKTAMNLGKDANAQACVVPFIGGAGFVSARIRARGRGTGSLDHHHYRPARRRGRDRHAAKRRRPAAVQERGGFPRRQGDRQFRAISVGSRRDLGVSLVISAALFRRPAWPPYDRN